MSKPDAFRSAEWQPSPAERTEGVITNAQSPRMLGLLLRALYLSLLPVALFGLWLVLSARYAVPAHPTIALVPSPTTVWNQFLLSWRGGEYLPALTSTAQEAGLGWLLGSALALPIGYLIGRFVVADRIVSPYLASSQAIPVVALAPLLVIWFGYGLEQKIVVVVLVTFFPVVATTASGVRSVEPDLRDVARVFGASWWQRLVYLDAPRSARFVFAGEKIAAALAVMGAVVAEFVVSNDGMGALVITGQDQDNVAKMFVAIVSLMLMGACAYYLVSITERIILQWTE